MQSREVAAFDRHPGRTIWTAILLIIQKRFTPAPSMRATDESVLPGLIDGEKRNVSKYDGAFDVARKSPDIANLLSTQRDRAQDRKYGNAKNRVGTGGVITHKTDRERWPPIRV